MLYELEGAWLSSLLQVRRRRCVFSRDWGDPINLIFRLHTCDCDIILAPFVEFMAGCCFSNPFRPACD